MEKCPGGEVFEKLVKLRRFTESDVVDFCKQMFSAIEYIHSLNIIHRDIKAENFLYARDGSVKLIDFGLAVRLRSDSEILKEVVGSAHYIAPEMLDRRYSKPVDIWSAGILIFLMLYGRYPFDAETDEGVMKKVKIGGIKWEESPDFAPSRDISHFLHCLLERDPSRRPSASSVLTEPFLSGSKTNIIDDPTASTRVLVSEQVIEKLSTSVILPTRSRRKEQLGSDTERSRSARILELEHQYEIGTLRGWRRSRKGPISVSAPTSPMNKQKVMGRQATKGLIGNGSGSSIRNDNAADSSPGKSPDSKRSRSLPGSFKVSFDPNPPDLYIYTEGTSSLIKVPSRPNSPTASRRS